MGVAIYPGIATVDGVRGDHVLIAPPYTVEKQELDRIVHVVVKAYNEVEIEVDKLLN